MALSSLLIAVLPTYERIGTWAAVILFAIRVIQGLATGAEAGVANAIAIELAPPGRQGRYLGLISGTFIQAGIFGSTLVAFLVSASVTRADLVDWAWRIPFAVGGVLGLAVIYLRSAVPETLIRSALHRRDELEQVQETTGGVWRTLWKVRLSLLAVVLVIGSIQIANYAWNTGLPNMANGVFRENSTAVFGITTAMGTVWIISGPLIGALADRIRLSRAFTILRLLLIPAFFITLFYTEPNVTLFALIMIGGGAIVGFNMSLYNYVATTLMPKSVRTTGVSVGYALGVSIFGGPSAYLLVWLQHHQAAWMFPVYGSVVTALSVIVYWSAKRRGMTYAAD
jgi:MHS family alpha-ketoglutarate permease-like MFS transporter